MDFNFFFATFGGRGGRGGKEVEDGKGGLHVTL